MMQIIQGSPEWFSARLGKVTASRVADIVATTKSGYAASRANYMSELLCERLTGQNVDSFCSPAMQWGRDKEPEARDAYTFFRDADVIEVGFVDHPRMEFAGASPDGLVGHDGLVEFKCPNTATHIETVLSGAVPEKYLCQVQWQLACTERAWCDFASYDPRLPEHMRLFIRRVERDAARIANLEQEVGKFLAELDAKISALSAATQQERAA